MVARSPGDLATARPYAIEAMEYEVEHMAQKREADNSYIAKLLADNEWMAQKLATLDSRARTRPTRGQSPGEQGHQKGAGPGTQEQAATGQPTRTTEEGRRASPLRLKATIHK